MEARTVDKFRQSFQVVRERLSDLKPAHKVLIGSGLVILLMGMFIVAQYSGKGSETYVDVDASVLSQARAQLISRGIDAVQQGSGFLVPRSQATDAFAVVSELSQNGAGATSFLGLIKDQPWYANRHQNKQQYYAALAGVLGEVIGRWSYVQKAEVFLTPPEESAGGLGRRVGKPTASIAVTPSELTLSPEQVEGLAMFLAGTVNGLEPPDVTVINARTGQSMHARNAEDRANGAYMELQSKVDAYWRAKVEDNLRHIPGVIVQINASVDASRERSNDVSYKKEGEGTVSPLVSETESKTESTEATSGGVPGVQPNAGASINAGSSMPSTNSQSETKAQFDPRTGVRETTREDPKGYARKINATVKVPESYYQRIWKLRNAEATDPPDAAAIKAIETDEITKITAEVRALIDTVAASADDGTVSSVGTVVVNTYTDLDPLAGINPAASAETSVLGLPGKLVSMPWGSVGLALLAALSLFMMFRLVRSSSASRELPSAEELLGIPPTLSTSIDELIGEADESEPAIDAVELDDEELRSRTIMQQIGDLVSRDAADATRVVNRWITSED